jgi:hypothetical protein
MALSTEVRDEMAAATEAALRGNIPDEEVTAAVTSIKSATASYPAGGSFLCTFFYFRITLSCQGESWVGNAGGLGGVGGASTNGDIYTDDINRLFKETTSFQFNNAVVYLNVNFFNSSSQFLGSYQGGGVGTCAGIGGGSGKWSS